MRASEGKGQRAWKPSVLQNYWLAQSSGSEHRQSQSGYMWNEIKSMNIAHCTSTTEQFQTLWLQFIYVALVCMCMGICGPTYGWRSKGNWKESVLSFHPVGPEGWSQDSGVLFLPSHLSGPSNKYILIQHPQWIHAIKSWFNCFPFSPCFSKYSVCLPKRQRSLVFKTLWTTKYNYGELDIYEDLSDQNLMNTWYVPIQSQMGCNTHTPGAYDILMRWGRLRRSGDIHVCIFSFIWIFSSNTSSNSTSININIMVYIKITFPLLQVPCLALYYTKVYSSYEWRGRNLRMRACLY